ncbi:MAG: M81 family metallopeptidase [Ectothiorhodospiraceae bacterium]|nr:M81 family metallopeptidase [Ectothiorhodospiraceae bacterium]
MSPSSGNWRVGIGALLFEGNTLSPVVTELRDFESKYLARGEDVLGSLRGSNTEMAGAIDTLELHAVDIAPLLATHGGAGGRVSAAAHAALTGDLLARLRAAMPLDALYLALHGAFVAQGVDDMEGALLALVREIVGDIPVAVSCDLHAHITTEMVRHADILIGYRHYPHDDTYDTGRRCAGLLLRTLRGQIRPLTVMHKVPMVVPAQKQRTKSDGPMGALHARARAREAAGDVLALSYFPVQPWLDFPDVAFTAVAVTDDDPEGAEQAAADLADAAWRRRHEFDVETVAPAEAIRAGLAVEGGPVVLADAADCTGGGATGDSAVVLAALLEHAPQASAVILIVDPETVAAATAAGIGGRFLARIGNKLDPTYGAPVEAEALVERLVDGGFTYTGGLLGGVTATMGPSAVLRVGAVTVVVASLSSYEYADEQLRAAGVDPWRCKFVVVKNPMNFQQAFADAPAAFTLDTPGPTTPNLARVPWRHWTRPVYPLDFQE